MLYAVKCGRMGIARLATAAFLILITSCEEILGHTGVQHHVGSDYDIEGRAVRIMDVQGQLGSPCDYVEWRRLRVTEFWIDFFYSNWEETRFAHHELNTLAQKASINISASSETLKSVCFLGKRLYECRPQYISTGTVKVEYKCDCMQYPINTTARDKEEDWQCLIQRGDRCAPKRDYGPGKVGEFNLYSKACDDEEELGCDLESQKCEPIKCNSTGCNVPKSSGTEFGASGAAIFVFCVSYVLC